MAEPIDLTVERAKRSSQTLGSRMQVLIDYKRLSFWQALVQALNETERTQFGKSGDAK